MKNLSHWWICLVLSIGSTVSAQTTPKLALAGVTMTPTLAKKYGAPASTTDTAAQPAAPTDPAASVLGTWQGTLQAPRGPVSVSLTITRAPDGSLRGDFYNETANIQFHVTSIMGNALNGSGNHLKLGLVNIGAKKPIPLVLMGDIDAGGTTMRGQWIAGGRDTSPLTLVRSGTGSASTPSPASAATLEDLEHSLNVQLFDHFSGEQLFSVMSDSDLKQAVPPAGKESQPAYDFKNSATLDQFKQAGINYLLVATLEDYQEQTLEMRRAQNLHYQTQNYAQARRPGSFASAGAQTQGGFDPEVWQRQIITLNVRFQLFDVTSGELRKSASSSFPCQRDFVAVAQGRNELSTADLLAAAAGRVSDWAAILVDDAIFPIEVLAKNDDVITISRGTEGGLKLGQSFNVYVSGDEIKDPHTGAVLGRDLKKVGRVSITDLQPKFSKAKILDDTGIVNGATLVRVNAK